jgi:hypothetical protein
MTRAAAGSERKLCSRHHLDDSVRKRIFPSDERHICRRATGS